MIGICATLPNGAHAGAVDCGGATWLPVADPGLTWAEAEQACVDLGGHLASIHSDEEQQCVVDLTTDAGTPGVGAWIGLLEENNEGEFNWSDGTPFDYDAWLAGEPNNDSGGIGDCGHTWLDSGGVWNDIICTRTDVGYICRL